ncbi:MAG: DUF86 domain-containing protein [Acidobacteria bacterium]|jgi:uncharacterized protein YutE (UPF0331/DUF86 family)|nr:DUF86 domain-containing protein [Acidobacteriota bacterium]
MPDYNLNRIYSIIGEINAAFTKLEKIKKLDKEEFINSPEKIDSAKYNLIVIIEGACDICNHIAVKSGGQAPASYADCFSILEELKFLSPELSTKLKLMAKFRNLLVHRYWKIGNDKVYDIIKQDIDVINDYIKKINSFLQLEKQKEG